MIHQPKVELLEKIKNQERERERERERINNLQKNNLSIKTVKI